MSGIEIRLGALAPDARWAADGLLKGDLVPLAGRHQLLLSALVQLHFSDLTASSDGWYERGGDIGGWLHTCVFARVRMRGGGGVGGVVGWLEFGFTLTLAASESSCVALGS